MSLMGFLDRVADVAALDKVVDPAQKAVLAVLRPPALKDLLHGTWLGHPVHPVLAQVPVGTWTSAGLLDLIPPLRPAATVLIGDRKSTRLNSSHPSISYAVFCLKKKKNKSHHSN